MNYEDVEQAIAEALQTGLGSGVDVWVLPDTVEEYAKTVTRPRVVVQYMSSEFSKPGGTFGYQDEKAMFRLIVQSKTRKGTSGILQVMADVQKYATGLKVESLGELYQVKIDLEEYNQKAKEWTYVVVVAADTIFVKDVPEADDPLISQITMQSNYNSSVIT